MPLRLSKNMSTSEKTLKLRVILDHTSIRKIVLPSCPETVSDLLSQLKTALKLNYDFRLQFEDPEFGNALCDLENIDELPPKATVKLIKTVELDGQFNDTEDTSSSSSQRSNRWPDVFTPPTFSYDVEFALRQGNSDYVKEKKLLKVTRDQKHYILERMVETIYGFKAYPSDSEFTKAAEALVQKHPCLKETGSKSGFDGWKVSLKFKMGNYRSKLRRAGIQELTINGGKRSRGNPNAEHSRANIKRPRRAEVNFLPNFPHGSDAPALEALRLELIDELKKKDQDVMKINQHMKQTFALRRKEIVQASPSVKEMMSRWPALFQEAQVLAEFHRITNQNLQHTFYTSLDKHTPQLLKLFRAKAVKGGASGNWMAKMLRDYDEQDKDDINIIRTLVLAGLPLYLKEDSSEVFKTHKRDEINQAQKAAVAIITVKEDEGTLPFNPLDVLIVLEDDVVIFSKSWVSSLVLLFGLLYALHISYPKKLIVFFEFIQKVLLKLDDGKASPKLLALKNELLN